MTSPAIIKQNFHIPSTVIKPCIVYAYYVIPFSKSDIQKLGKVLSKLTKEICNISKSTTNILYPLYRQLWHQHNILPTRLHTLDRQTIRTHPPRICRTHRR